MFRVRIRPKDKSQFVPTGGTEMVAPKSPGEIPGDRGESGVEIGVIAQSLGDESIEATRGYVDAAAGLLTDLTGDLQRRAVDRGFGRT